MVSQTSAVEIPLSDIVECLNDGETTLVQAFERCVRRQARLGDPYIRSTLVPKYRNQLIELFKSRASIEFAAHRWTLLEIQKKHLEKAISELRTDIGKLTGRTTTIADETGAPELSRVEAKKEELLETHLKYLTDELEDIDHEQTLLRPMVALQVLVVDTKQTSN